jgi:nucleotide-binding universal stress UspA family protein
MFQKLIVGVDGLQGGRDAIALAGAIQAATGAELTLVHAYPTAGDDVDRSDNRHAAIAALETAREDAGIEASIQAVGERVPPRALHAVAADQDADAIVVGSSHHGKIGRVLLGDVAADTLADAPCAVAIAPRGQALRNGGITRIGVAFDGSPEAEAAVDAAAELAGETGAAIELVTVIHPPSPWGLASGYAFDWTEVESELRTAALAALDRRIDDFEGVRAEGRVVVGVTGTALTAFSKTVDMLFTGSRGGGVAHRLVLGSTSRHLAAHAASAIVVVPRATVSDDRKLSPTSAARGGV